MKQRVNFRHRLLATLASVAIMVSSLSTGVFADGETRQSSENDYIGFSTSQYGFNVYGVKTTTNPEDETKTHTPVQTTFSDRGYGVLFQYDDSHKIMSHNLSSTTPSSLRLGEDQVLAGYGSYNITAQIEDSGKSVLITYSLTNLSGADHEFQIATVSDCQIGGNDQAQVEDYNGGFRMTDDNSTNSTYGSQFTIIPVSNPFTTRWIGENKANRSTGYTGRTDKWFADSISNTPGMDSALAWSWKVPIAAGQTVQLTCKFTILVADTITFNGNGGFGTMANTGLIAGETGTLPLNSFTAPDGYTFAGWSKSPQALTPDYLDGGEIVIDGDTTLYAFWQPPFNPPVANTLMYNGSPQALVTPGVNNRGTVKYRLGETGDFLETVPAATSADEYTVYYYYEGTDGSIGSEESPMSISISISPLCTVPSEQLVYNGQPQLLVNTDSTVSIPDGKKIYYKVDHGTYSENPPTATSVGNHVVSYYIGTENDPPANPEQVTVNIAHLITPKDNLSYTGSPVDLIEDVPAEAGIIYYQVDGGNWTTEMPTAISSGNHTIRYYVGDNSNTAQEITATIAAPGNISITINTGDADTSSTLDDVNPETFDIASIETPSRGDGYEFAGWYTDSGCTQPFNPDNHGIENITLYAGWNANLILHANNGTNATENESRLIGVDLSLPGCPFTRPHHLFLGWARAANATEPDYPVGYPDLTINISENTDLYAVWHEQYSVPTGISGLSYTGHAQDLVTRDTSDGVRVTYSLSQNGVFSETIPQATSSGTHTVYYYVEGDAVRHEIEVTIASITIPVSFDDGNSGTYAIQMVDPEHPSTSSTNQLQLPNPEPTREGYTFAGWYTDSDLQNKLTDNFSNLGAEDITLYAGWYATLTFDANGGTITNGVTSNTQLAGVATAIPSVVCTRAHYEFIGWSEDPSNSEAPLYQTGDNYTIAANTTLYAVWQEKFATPTARENLQYNGTEQPLVTRDSSLDADGENIRVLYSTTGAPGSFSEAIPTGKASGTYKVYYYVEGVGDENNYQEISNITIESKEIKVTFDDGIDNGTDPYREVDAEHPENLTLITPDARPGYSFDAWYVDAGLTTRFDPTNPVNLGTQDTKLYAGWKATITFNANGGTGTMTSQEMLTGVSRTLNSNSFERNHYTFAGWAVSSNTNEVRYADGATINIDGNTTLYAVWVANFNVPTAVDGLHYNGGMQNLVTRDPSLDQEPVTIRYSLTRNGTYTTTIPQGKEAKEYTVFYYAEGDEDNIQSVTVTIEPKYTQVTIDDGVNAPGAPVQIDVEHPETVTLPTNPTREGYVFGGWYTDEALTQEFDPTDSTTLGVQDAVTIRAGWKAEVTFDANGGTGTMGSDYILTESNQGIPTNQFEREHHIFLGWATTPDATEPEFDDYLNINGATTLYAVWSADYTAPVSAGTLYYNGEPQPLVTRDTDENIPVWYSLTDEPGSYTTTIPTAKDAGDYTVYYYVDGDNSNNRQTLNVTINPITIIATLDDGDVDTTNATVSIDPEHPGNAQWPADPTREGYRFAGWYMGDGFDNEFDPQNPGVVGEALQPGELGVTLHPGWEAEVTFDANGGNGATYGSYILTDTSDDLPANHFTRSHHTFLGWATSPDATEAEFEDGADIVITEATTLYAVWQSDYAAPTAVTGLAYNGQAQALVSRDESQDAQGENVTIYYALSENGPFSTTMPTATESGSYTVYYYVDGDESNIEQFTVTIDAVTVPVTIDGTTTNMNAEDTLTRPADPTRPGYEFTGWYTDEACTQPYDFNSPVGANGVTLYAGWNDVREDATCTTAPSGLDGVSYNGQGQALVAPGSTEDGTIYYSLSENGPFSTTIPVASASGTYTVYYYVAGDELHHDSALQHFTVTIAPQYVPVTFDGTTTTANAELPLTRPADPSRDGYTFTGWYADEACTQPYDFSSPVGVLGVRLYSGWRLNPAYSVTEGAGSEFTINGTNGLRFRAVRNTDEASTFSHFTGVSVDGQLIDPSNYTAVSGSVIVTLNASYLNTLSAGTHTLSIHFNDGDSVTTTFTVVTASGVANTGEDPHSVTSALGVILLLAGVAVTYYKVKARKEEI